MAVVWPDDVVADAVTEAGRVVVVSDAVTEAGRVAVEIVVNVEDKAYVARGVSSPSGP
jgi:hypothetical protein